MNILKADLFYLIKDKTFRVLLIITAVMPVISCWVAYKFSGGQGINAETVVTQCIGADIMCALLGIGMASFFGHDFANNTIRNKVCYGVSRKKIVLLSFVECTIITASILLVNISVSFIAAAISGTTNVSDGFWLKYFCQIGILFAFAWLITALTLCTKSSKPGIFATVIMTIFVAAAAQLIPKLAKISDVARVVSRSLYMTVSTMMMKSVDGSYIATEGVVYDNMYLNAILMTAFYCIIAVFLSLFVVKRQSYK